MPRLSPPLTESKVVFDKLNGQLYMSELLVPGLDGYVLLPTKEAHTRESMTASGTRK